LRGSDYGQLLSDAINQLSDDLGQQYAVLESVNSSEDKRMSMEIENVDSLASFVRVRKYLSSLQSVQNVQMQRITGDKVEFSLSLRSKVDEFINLLAGSSHIKAVQDTGINPDTGPVTQPGGVITQGSQPQTQAAVATTRLYHYRLVR